MAKASRKEETKRGYDTRPVILEMTSDEAIVVCTLLGHVVGSSDIRTKADSVYCALVQAGVGGFRGFPSIHVPDWALRLPERPTRGSPPENRLHKIEGHPVG